MNEDQEYAQDAIGEPEAEDYRQGHQERCPEPFHDWALVIHREAPDGGPWAWSECAVKRAVKSATPT